MVEHARKKRLHEEQRQAIENDIKKQKPRMSAPLRLATPPAPPVIIDLEPEPKPHWRAGAFRVKVRKSMELFCRQQRLVGIGDRIGAEGDGAGSYRDEYNGQYGGGVNGCCNGWRINDVDGVNDRPAQRRCGHADA